MAEAVAALGVNIRDQIVLGASACRSLSAEDDDRLFRMLDDLADFLESRGVRSPLWDMPRYASRED